MGILASLRAQHLPVMWHHSFRFKNERVRLLTIDDDAGNNQTVLRPAIKVDLKSIFS